MSDSTPTPSLRATPQPTTRVSKSARTRADIVNAVLEFTWNRPFSEMTVGSLMTMTSSSRSTFYLHFKDLHEPMEAVLEMLKDEIFAAVAPWLSGTGDPVVLILETIESLVRVGHARGPFLKAITDAAASDVRLEKAWEDFLRAFDVAGAERIREDQARGLIPEFDPEVVTYALNRMNARTLIGAFGKHPRSQPETVSAALARVWVSTLYGARWMPGGASDLIRT